MCKENTSELLMKLNPRFRAAYGLLVVIFVLILTINSQSLLNWYMSSRLHSYADVNKRIVLLNMSRSYSTNYWNQQYLLEAYRANSEVERRFIADIIHERFGTNETSELQQMAARPISESSRSNILAVINFYEK